jgi:lipopolysaccharide export system permease protein
VDENDPEKYLRLQFETHSIKIPDVGDEMVRTARAVRSDRELSTRAMREKIRDLSRQDVRTRERADENVREYLERMAETFDSVRRGSLAGHAPDVDGLLRVLERKVQQLAHEMEARASQRDRYWVEIHKKYAIPFACMVFVLVGAPIGVRAHRGGLGVGLGLSMGFFTLYYMALIGGEDLADRGIVPPSIAMWAANVVLAAVGLLLLRAEVRESRTFQLPQALRGLFRRGSEAASP